MDLGRLRTGDWITGGAGLALLLLLWAPWYGLSDGTLNGWGAFGLIDLFLALTALLAIAVPVSTAVRDTPAVPVAVGVACWDVALLAVLLALFRLAVVPQGDVVTGREWGVFAGTAAALLLFAGAWLAMRDESAPRLRPNPEPELQAAPAPGAGPERTVRET